MKKFAGNLLAFFISLFIALLLAELLSRVFLGPPQTVFVTAKDISGLSRPGKSIEKKPVSLQAHPDEGGVYLGTPTGKRLRPNRHITIENHRLSHQKVVLDTNSLGYRNPEIGKKTKTRILFLGDSITFQDYLNEKDTFVRQIEGMAAQEGQQWETINAGVGAISLKTELAILQESGLGLDPDVVVLDFYLNDFQESRGVKIVSLPWVLQHSWFAYHLMEWLNQQRGQYLLPTEINLEGWRNDFVKNRSFSTGNFNKSPDAFNQMIVENFHDYGAAWSEDAWRYMKPLFMELKRLSVEHHFKLLIVVFPVYQQVYTEFPEDEPQQYLKNVAGEMQIPVLDLLPVLRSEALRLGGPSIYHTQVFYSDLFYDQCHHTPAGSALIAGQIYDFLKTQQVGQE